MPSELRQRLEHHPARAVINGFRTHNMTSYTQDMVTLATAKNAVLLVQDAAAMRAAKKLAAKGKTLLAEAVSSQLVARNNMLLIDDDVVTSTFQSLYDLAEEAVAKLDGLASAYPYYQDQKR